MSSDDLMLLVALGVALLVWGGLFFYLWRLDALAHELRRRLERIEPPTHATPPIPSATLTRNDPSESGHMPPQMADK